MCIIVCHLDVGGKPDVMQVLGIYNFGKSNEHAYGAAKHCDKSGQTWIRTYDQI